MARIAVNTNYEAAATKALVTDLVPRLQKAGHYVVRNDWDHYPDYDLVLFMSPDQQVAQAKRSNPQIRAGIIDPKTDKKRLASIRAADFLVVTSLEQRDALLAHNNTIFVYLSLPNRAYRQPDHQEKDKLVIGYHGNKEHLLCFHPHITHALDLSLIHI